MNILNNPIKIIYSNKMIDSLPDFEKLLSEKKFSNSNFCDWNEIWYDNKENVGKSIHVHVLEILYSIFGKKFDATDIKICQKGDNDFSIVLVEGIYDGISICSTFDFNFDDYNKECYDIQQYTTLEWCKIDIDNFVKNNKFTFKISDGHECVYLIVDYRDGLFSIKCEENDYQFRKSNNLNHKILHFNISDPDYDVDQDDDYYDYKWSSRSCLVDFLRFIELIQVD